MTEPENPSGAGAADGDTVKKLMDQVAELSAAMKSRNSEYDTLKETYERTNALLESMMNNPDRGRGNGAPPAGGSGSRGSEVDLSDINFDELGIPKQAAEVIIQRTLKMAEQRLEGRVMSMTQMAQSREKFYKDNPDLVGFEYMVGSISQQVQQEQPNAPLEKSFAEVAKRTRAEIKRIQDARSGGDSGVPPVAGGGGSREGGHPAGGSGGEGNEPEPTPDAELQAEVAARNKMRAKGFNRSRSV